MPFQSHIRYISLLATFLLGYSASGQLAGKYEQLGVTGRYMLLKPNGRFEYWIPSSESMHAVRRANGRYSVSNDTVSLTEKPNGKGKVPRYIGSINATLPSDFSQESINVQYLSSGLIPVNMMYL